MHLVWRRTTAVHALQHEYQVVLELSWIISVKLFFAQVGVSLSSLSFLFFLILAESRLLLPFTANYVSSTFGSFLQASRR